MFSRWGVTKTENSQECSSVASVKGQRQHPSMTSQGAPFRALWRPDPEAQVANGHPVGELLVSVKTSQDIDEIWTAYFGEAWTCCKSAP